MVARIRKTANVAGVAWARRTSKVELPGLYAALVALVLVAMTLCTPG